MADPFVVDAGEEQPEDILQRLNDGQRVIVRTEMLGSEYEVTLRWDGEVYYCDTPTRLHRHETESEMRACLEHQGYVEDVPADEESE